MILERTWNHYPALKLALAYAAGIALARVLAPSAEQLAILLFGVMMVMAWQMTREGGVLAPALAATLVLCGAMNQTLRTADPLDLFAGLEISTAEIEGRVVESPIVRGGRIEFLVACDRLSYRNSVVPIRTRAIVRLHDPTPFDPALLPAVGRRVSVVGRVAIPQRPANPGGFDLRRYYQSQGIGLVLTAQRAAAVYTWGADDRGPIERVRDAVRSVVGAFADSLVGGEEGDIVRALLVGERRFIDPATVESYMRTGAIHVLSVSGLHVGVIALALFVLASWLPWRSAQVGVFLLLLSAYATIAGAGPAILRASVMASVFVIARALGRMAHPLNTLGVAALVLLVAGPEQLFDMGFQLSFASVGGIVLLFGPVWNFLRSRFAILARNALLRSIVQLVIVSVCAQAFTLPLVVHHFGYVSLNATLVNLPVVPLYSFALGAALLGVLAMPMAPGYAALCGGAAFAAIRLANAIVAWGAASATAGFELRAFTTVAALLLLATLVWLSLSRTPYGACVRFVAVVVCFYAVAVASAFDPLAREDDYLVLLTARNGLMPAIVTRDSILLCAPGGTTGEAEQALRGLRRRFGPRGHRLLRVDTVDERQGDLLYLCARPPAAASSRLPVIFTTAGPAELGLVRVGTEELLRVPLHAEIPEAIVLRFDGRWTPVDW